MMDLLRCSICGTDNTPGPPDCSKCGASLKTATVIRVRSTPTDTRQHVIVTDVKIPFVSMVTLLLTWALASIPAVLILMVVGVAGMMVLTAIFGAAF